MMFLYYKENDIVVYIPLSNILKIEVATDECDLCIYLKEVSDFTKAGRTEEEIRQLSIVVVPVNQFDFVLKQLLQMQGGIRNG